MNLTFTLTIQPDATQLPNEDLPAQGLALFSPDSSHLPFATFAGMLDEITAAADPLLWDLFDGFFPGRNFAIPITATAGAPAPYDAWCTNGGRLYFNLSEWSEEALARAGRAVILHESTHFLIRQLYPNDPPGWSEKLDFLIFNEGVAHYIGFPKGRENLLTQYADRWPPAEARLAEAYRRLNDPLVDETAKTALLDEADTGPYWQKFGSISGMFRAAHQHAGGLPALIECVRRGHLPDVRT